MIFILKVILCFFAVLSVLGLLAFLFFSFIIWIEDR